MRRALLALFCLIAAMPANAQPRPAPPISIDTEDEDQPPLEPLRPLQTGPAQAGRVANSAVGEVGQRQTRNQTPGIAPMARIAGRIQNRVQSRIRNRIDRSYDAQANTTSPFAVAEEQTRTASRPKR